MGFASGKNFVQKGKTMTESTGRNAQVLAYPVRTWIVEDHASIRELLVEFLAEQEGFQVLGAGDDPEPALTAAREKRVDMIILDLSLPKSGGLYALEQLSKIKQAPRVIVFSAMSSPQTVGAAIEFGAVGYVEKTAPLSELRIAIQRVREGGVYFSEGPTHVMHQLAAATAGKARSQMLTPRELEFLRLLARGEAIKAIAKALNLSEGSAYRIRRELFGKLGSNSDQELALAAMSMGLLDMGPMTGEPTSPGAKIVR